MNSVSPIGRPTNRRTRVNKARRAVWWGIASFGLAQLTLALAFARWVPEGRDPSYGLKVKQLQARLERCASQAELIVMLGSSRTAFGLDGTLLEEDLSREHARPVVLYNFGRLGGGPVVDCVYLHRLLAAGIRPQLLVVEVPPYMMTSSGTKYELESLQVGPLAPDDRALLRRLGCELEDALPGWVDAAVPVYSRRRLMLYKAAPTFLPRDVRAHCLAQWWQGLTESGWVAGARAGPRQENENAHMQMVQPLLACMEKTSFQKDLPACRALDDIMQLTQTEGIALAVIVMPESPRLRQSYPEHAWERLWAYLKDSCTRRACPLINARDWVPAEHFADPDHLAPAGARLFTERFGRDHLRTLLNGATRPTGNAGLQTRLLTVRDGMPD